MTESGQRQLIQDPSDLVDTSRVRLPEGIKVWDTKQQYLPDGDTEPITMPKGSIERLEVDKSVLHGEGYIKFRQPGASGERELLPLAVIGAGASNRRTEFILVSNKLLAPSGDVPQRNVHGLLAPLKDGGYEYVEIPPTYDGDVKFMNVGKAFHAGKGMKDEENPGKFDGTTSDMHFVVGSSGGYVYIRDMGPTNNTYLNGAKRHPAVESLKLTSQVSSPLGRVALNS